MRVLPFISGKLFLILYAIYSYGIVRLASMIIKKSGKEDYMAESISKDEFFVLTQSYNIKHIFYYITYKLYDMKVLGKNSVKRRFYPCNKEAVELQPLEKEVFKVYESNNGFVLKEFKNSIVNENVFKEFYNNICSDLEDRGFFKDKKQLRNNKIAYISTILLLLIPSAWRAMEGIAYGEPVTNIMIETIIIFIISLIFLSEYRTDRLSGKAKASIVDYRKNNGGRKIDYRSSKESADYSGTGNSNDHGADNIVSGAALGYMVGVNQINDSSNGDGDF